MNSFFHNTLGPVGWTLLGIIPPAIFALYFLKLKRQPLEVPSTYMWHRVIEDLHVNSLWQRLRRSLLLLLQLLVVLLAILALLRPGWQGQTLEGQRFVFLIDRSASMSSRDGPEGRSRLEEAKRRVRSLIDQLQNDMSAMIIAFDSQPDVIQEFTDNRNLLRDALDQIEPTAAGTDLRGALQLADGFANPVRVSEEERDYAVGEEYEVELYIFSDGRFGSIEGFSLGNLQPLYLPIGSSESQNMAITALNAQRSSASRQQAFVQVANYGDQPETIAVELFLNDSLIDAAELAIPARDVASTTFVLGEESSGQLQAKLDVPETFDDRLALDNSAYAILEERRDARVLLVTAGNLAIESALSTARAARLAKIEKIAPDDLLQSEVASQMQTEWFDLVIFDRSLPQTMPRAHTLFVGRVPPIASWSHDEKEELISAPQILDWQRSHPLLNLLELGNVLIADTQIVKPPLGGRVLIDSTHGPLLAIAPRDRYEDAALGFEIVAQDKDGQRTFNTDWPRKHSFPSFWLNAIEYFTVGAGSTRETLHPGKLVELRLPIDLRALEVELPDGTLRKVELDEPGRLAFHETGQRGVYTVRSENKIVKQFAVNLFDRAESDIRLRTRQRGEGVQVVDSLSIGYIDVEAQSPTLPVRQEIWKPLLLGALAVLVLEWYIYNRRVYI